MFPTRTARPVMTWLLTACLTVGTSMSVHPAAQAPNPPADGDPRPDDSLVVRMIDGVDSSRDTPGREYRAVVVKGGEGGSVPIAKGSAAKVVAAKAQSGWVTQLVSVNINGADTNVTSSSASVTGLMSGTVGGAVNAATSLFAGFGKKKANASPETATASGDRIRLLPGTEVRFQLAPSTPTAVQPTSRGVTPEETRRGSGK